MYQQADWRTGKITLQAVMWMPERDFSPEQFQSESGSLSKKCSRE